jgi:hypothetical protein
MREENTHLTMRLCELFISEQTELHGTHQKVIRQLNNGPNKRVTTTLSMRNLPWPINLEKKPEYKLTPIYSYRSTQFFAGTRAGPWPLTV